MILFINCCPRTDSNTRRLVDALLEKLGPYVADYGYNFVESLTVKCFGIKSAELIKAELLDAWGADRDKIMSDAINGIRI